MMLTNIVNNMGELIAAMDTSYNFTFFNTSYKDEFKNIFGKDIVIGDNILDVLQHLPGDQKMAKHIWSRALNGENFVVIQQFGDIKLQRNTYEISYTCHKSNNIIIGASHVVRDVSIRETMKLKAEHALENKQHFIRHMNHELRTPLNSIIGFTQLLPYDHDNIDLYCSTILRSSKYLLGLINDTLDISHLDETLLSVEPVNPYVLCVDVCGELMPMVHKNNVSITVSIKNKDQNILADNQRYNLMRSNITNTMDASI
jgi:signal transduction histidine kinase